MHIQGSGGEINRNYGVAIDLSKSSFGNDLWNYMTELSTPNKSLYPGSPAKYFELQAKVAKAVNVVHFQIASEKHFNRDYGASFELPIDNCTQDLANFIVEELDLNG